MNAPTEPQEGWLLHAPEGAYEALIVWFRTLQFRHAIETHHLIIASLEWPELRAIFTLAVPGGDYDSFAHQVLQEARLARQAGKVVPSGLTRRKGGGRKPKYAEVKS